MSPRLRSSAKRNDSRFWLLGVAPPRARDARRPARAACRAGDRRRRGHRRPARDLRRETAEAERADRGRGECRADGAEPGHVRLSPAGPARRRRRRPRGAAAAAAALVALVLLAGGAAAGRSSGAIVVGSKNFTEQLILGELLAQTIERGASVPVERRLNLGGTLICDRALAGG